MSKSQRVTTDEVLDLHAEIVKLRERAKGLSQTSVWERLDAILVELMIIAKSTALDEAISRRSLASAAPNMSDPGGGK